MPKIDYVEVCPKCGSPDYHIENDAVWSGDNGFYVCNKCGHNAKFFPKVKLDKVEGFSKEAKRKSMHEKPHAVEKSFFSWHDLAALILGVLSFFIVGIAGFLVIVGGYFTIKKLFFSK